MMIVVSGMRRRWDEDRNYDSNRKNDTSGRATIKTLPFYVCSRNSCEVDVGIHTIRGLPRTLYPSIMTLILW
jgi:hypothetical protein